jgi:hypothetical protein
MQHSFIIDVEIVNAYGLRLTQKSLTKTESLPTKKSSMQHSFIADVEIVNAYGLLPPPWPKTLLPIIPKLVHVILHVL